MRILFCGSGWLPIVDEIRAWLPPHHSIDVWDRAQPLQEAVVGVQVILPSNAGIDASIVEAARDLRLIQQPAAGVDAIDVGCAQARGIPVCNAPGANGISVAEAALFLMLALARRYPRARAAFERSEIGGPLGMELCERTLGIVGTGRSGRALAVRASALGMTVLTTRSTSTRADLLAMLAASDVVSLHCPLTEDTRHMIDAEALAAMRAGALLVNCARGPIINRADLEKALDTGHLGGVGLDTFWREPWDPADPLFARDDVVTLPHVAGSTVESFGRIATIVCENIARIERGDEPLHRVA